MVDSVKNAISRIETPKVRKTDIPSDKGARGSNSAQAQASAAVSDSVQLKSAEIASSVKEMAAAAPVDMKNVDRIKSAIKEGKYPIDIDKISDALMDAYRELKS
jgi:negative regulator of flagellin synthesis FlgM